MGNYRLQFKACVAKDLRPLPKQDVARLLRSIGALAQDPRPPGREKLSGEEKYRIRQGRYRIIYEIRDAQLIVLAVKTGQRREIPRRR